MTDEQEQAERFCLDLDRMAQNPSEDIRLDGAPEEYVKAVELARFMASEDFGDQCLVRDELRRRLTDRVSGRGSGRPGGFPGDQELDDDQLDMVAAGTGSQAAENGFGASGCSRPASGIKGGFCPDCGRPRGVHPKG